MDLEAQARVVVRPVRAEDVPSVVALVTEVLAEFGLTFGDGSATDEQLRQLPRSYEEVGGAFWVAVDATKGIVGTCGVFPLDEEEVELRKMYLLPSVRGTGLASRLLNTAVTFARASGARRMVLDTTSQMHRARAFYEAHGFVRDDAQIRGARCDRGYTRAL